jgi:triosephosphate isomerase
MRKKYMAGNWKMNLLPSTAQDLVESLAVVAPKHTQVIYFPQAPFLGCLQQWNLGKAQFGAQNISSQSSGAFTGETSAELVRALGGQFTLLGHSERRTLFGETSAQLQDKIVAAWKHQLLPILCIGETLEEREDERHFEVIKNQLMESLHGLLPISADLILAYEPVWAIGTGKTASVEQAVEVHRFIRSVLNEMQVGLGETTSILYGGSVNAGNAKELFSQSDIDGGLVGGASLKIEDFRTIIQLQDECLHA